MAKRLATLLTLITALSLAPTGAQATPKLVSAIKAANSLRKTSMPLPYKAKAALTLTRATLSRRGTVQATPSIYGTSFTASHDTKDMPHSQRASLTIAADQSRLTLVKEQKMSVWHPWRPMMVKTQVSSTIVPHRFNVHQETNIGQQLGDPTDGKVQWGQWKASPTKNVNRFGLPIR